MKEYDLIVIGAGPGGTPAAMAAAQFGKRVLLVDRRGEPGGECLFEGCIPSKILENAANRYASFQKAAGFHIELRSTPQIHWEEVLKEKERILQMRSQAALKRIEALPTLDFLAGEAKFVDERIVEVDGERYGFAHAIVATGATAHLPPIEGDGLAKAWTNADIFRTPTIPDTIAFIGAGAISCELAQMFRKLGSRCIVMERGERILRKIDADAAMVVQKRMQEMGIELLLGVTFESIEGELGAYKVHYKQNGESWVLEVPHLLVATGRSPNVEGLGLDVVGVEFDRHGILTDATMKTTNERIYAVGDCTTGPKFAHWATYQAGLAVHNIYAPKPRLEDRSKLAWVLFSDPQIASAGMSEEEAKRAGMEVRSEIYPYKVEARAQIDHETDGLVKFVLHEKRIVGVQIVAPQAGSLSGEASMIVAHKMSIEDLLATVHPHPTYTEALGSLARNIFFQKMARR